MLVDLNTFKNAMELHAYAYTHTSDSELNLYLDYYELNYDKDDRIVLRVISRVNAQNSLYVLRCPKIKDELVVNAYHTKIKAGRYDVSGRSKLFNGFTGRDLSTLFDTLALIRDCTIITSNVPLYELVAILNLALIREGFPYLDYKFFKGRAKRIYLNFNGTVS